MRFILLFLLAGLCTAGSVIAAGKIVPPYSTNSTDETACQRQLNIIYGALQEYQRRNQSLPHWLSDLAPEFLYDPNALVCPFVGSTGNLKKWREQFVTVPVFGDPGSCSYGYEFCEARFIYLPGWTTRIYKQRQMELIGFGVPIVRCFAHRPVLNLGFDGSIYPSGGEWEDNFATSAEHRAILHNVLVLTNISENRLISRLSEPRNAETDARMLDLATHYNASLLHLSQIDQSGKLLATYPEGVQKIGGADFDVRGLVHLTARRFPIAFPDRVANIPVNRKCASMHFLHGTIFVANNGSKVASFVIHLADGSKAEVPVVYGKDVKTRWFDRNQKSEWENPKPAWTTPPDKVGPTGKSLRLYVSSWKNQSPDTEVTSIDFISGMSDSAPFLLAITAE